MKCTPVSALSKICAIVAVATLFASVSWASSYRSLYSFTGGGDGGDPATALAFDSAGNAYGTTVTGGADGCGTVFQLTPSGGQWTETVLYSFTCFADGKNPYGGVTLDTEGNLYGTTVAGGSGGTCTGDGCGVVFKLTKSGSMYNHSVLYNFTGGNDGFGPGSAVVFDSSGNLYGTTPDGGAYGFGVIYQLSPNAGGWTQTVLHAFTGGSDGAVGSLGALLIDAHGNLFGVTEIGGDNSVGTVYEISPTGGSWNFTTLYAFAGQPDAAFPYGGLIADASGALYGTTYFGGANGMGAVYELRPTPSGWKEFVLYSFQGGTDGSLPTSTLLFDSAGHLYGTTTTGGNPGCDCGTIFQLSPASVIRWKETVVHVFGSSQDGAYPSYGLTSDSMGNLYGTAVLGGAHGQGMVFEFTP